MIPEINITHLQMLKLDADSPLQALRIARSLSEYPDAEMRRSSSGRGWHFRVPSVITGTRQNIRLRKTLHDCLGRTRADNIRMKLQLPTNVLFAFKNGSESSPWEPMDIVKIYRSLKIVEVKQ